MQLWRNIIRLIRIEQWVKNLFVFIPIFFAAKAADTTLLLNVVLAFFSFSLMASCIYIVNDYVDIESDKLHPTKRLRPLASGTVSKNQGIIIAGILALFSIGIAVLVSPPLFYIIAGYFIMNLAYSAYLKRIALVDVSIIGIGFLLRIFAGGVAAQAPISNWLIVLTFLLALILALGKRRGEYVLQKGNFGSRSVLHQYNLPFIDAAITFLSAITVVAYLMYSISDEVVNRIGSDQIYFTGLFVILGMLRYLQLTFVYQKTESPTKVFWQDRFIQVLLLAWAASFAYLIYFQ